MKWLLTALLTLISTVAFASVDIRYPLSGSSSSLPLPGGDTSYIQNNPSIVQVATMSITGQAGFDHAGFSIYASSPSAKANGSVWLAKDSGSTFPCIFFFYGGARYHMCGCPESGPATNSGQCMGLMCGVTYP